jgi:hypothetical protein
LYFWYVKSLKLNFPFGLIQEICLKYDAVSIIKYHMFWFFLSKYDVFLSSEIKTIVDLDCTCTCNISRQENTICQPKITCSGKLTL